MGRKTKYEDSFVTKVEELAKKGLHDYQIWESLGISHDSFYQYLNKYSEFSDALKRGRDVCVKTVESSLFKRAIGYEEIEETTEVKINEDGTTKPVMLKKVKKHYPPDVGAIAFYLKNKDSQNWRDKQEVDHTTKGESMQPKTIIVTNEESKKIIEKFDATD
jgi:hypothetical protein